MNLFDTLKQFKHIEPDSNFTERSKREILLSPQNEPFRMRGIFTLLHALETGAAVALAGLFILIMTNSITGGNSIAPIQYSVIDPAGLHAEAQAIDMQIQLANIQYPQTTSTVSGATTPASASAFVPMIPKAIVNQSSSATSTAGSASTSTTSAASSTPTSTLSVDQALQQLSR